MKAPPSLQRKIALGYYLFGSCIVVLAVFMFVEIHFMETRFSRGEVVFQFFENTLEVRRYEKNFFLYSQPADYQQNSEHVAQALQLLKQNHALFNQILGAGHLQSLESRFGDYQQAMQSFSESLVNTQPSTKTLARMEEDIRSIGKEITSATNILARDERRLVHRSIERSIQGSVIAILVLAAVAILVGRLLSRKVIVSLKALENSMGRVVEDGLQPLQLSSKDRELVSLQRTFDRMLHALEQQKKHMVQSEKLASLGTMLSGVAHELNNPLSNISTSCQILMEEADGIDAGYRQELFDQIDDQIARAKNIIRTLLDFPREKVVDRKPVYLHRLIDESMPLLTPQLPTGIALQVNVPEDILLTVNKQQIQQVFLNLIKNSINALGDRGAIVVCANIPAHATIEPGKDDEHRLHDRSVNSAHHVAVIRVQDNGPGIPLDAQPRIFDPFFTTREVGEGSGLGLFVSHEIITEHDGTIVVESAPDEGTVFVITLPLTLNQRISQLP